MNYISTDSRRLLFVAFLLGVPLLLGVARALGVYAIVQGGGAVCTCCSVRSLGF